MILLTMVSLGKFIEDELARSGMSQSLARRSQRLVDKRPFLTPVSQSCRREKCILDPQWVFILNGRIIRFWGVFWAYMAITRKRLLVR